MIRPHEDAKYICDSINQEIINHLLNEDLREVLSGVYCNGTMGKNPTTESISLQVKTSREARHAQFLFRWELRLGLEDKQEEWQVTAQVQRPCPRWCSLSTRCLWFTGVSWITKVMFCRDIDTAYRWWSRCSSLEYVEGNVKISRSCHPQNVAS